MNVHYTPDPEWLKQLASIKLVTRKQAAKQQLETAIWLWFHLGLKSVVADTASVHTLAVASQGVISAISRDSNQDPSMLMKAIKSQPADMQEWLRNPQNFFKHGNYTGRGKQKGVTHQADLTEVILADNAMTFNRLYQVSTPLLDMFLLRFSLTFPESQVSLKTLEIELTRRGFVLKSLAAVERKRFYDVLYRPVVEFSLETGYGGVG